MNQPQSRNPALAGYPQSGQPQQPQAQHPQQPQSAPPPQQGGGPSGLLGPDGQPVMTQQQMIPLRLTPDGPELPTPTMDPHALVQMMGGQISGEAVLTWLEVARALSGRDAEMLYLQARIQKIEEQLGITPPSLEEWMEEQRRQYMAARTAEGAQGPQGAPPQSAPPQGAAPHGMPGGQG